MDTITFLEQLAQNAYYSLDNEIVINQPPKVKEAFLTNNANLLKSQISNQECFANESHVIQALIYDFNDMCNPPHC